MSNSLNLWFAGTPDFASSALSALLSSQHRVLGALSQPPKPKGRGLSVTHSPVSLLAQQHNIPVHTPETLKTPDFQTVIQNEQCDALIVAAYGKLLPKWLLEWPTYGCINIHASLLPKYRGASPIHHAILSGETSTGITIMQMTQGLDEGPILQQASTPISPTDNVQAVHDKLAVLGADQIVLACNDLPRLLSQASSQDPSYVSFAPKISKSDGRIDWQQPATDIANRIRAFDPWPGTFSTLDNKQIKILDGTVVSVTEQPNLKPGSILKVDSDSVFVQCGSNTAIQITKIQLPGKKKSSVAETLRGHSGLFTQGACWL